VAGQRGGPRRRMKTLASVLKGSLWRPLARLAYGGGPRSTMTRGTLRQWLRVFHSSSEVARSREECVRQGYFVRRRKETLLHRVLAAADKNGRWAAHVGTAIPWVVSVRAWSDGEQESGGDKTRLARSAFQPGTARVHEGF
jgi:hypothetical protein